MSKALRISAFLVVALLGFAGGVTLLQLLWRATHHRYDTPNTGVYQGVVDAVIDGTDDDVYSFRFRASTEPRWYLIRPTNFAYRSLHFDWFHLDWFGRRSEGTGTVVFPSLHYESTDGSGLLTTGVLTKWLLDGTNAADPNTAVRSVDALFGFIVAAGQGALPPPCHHNYYFDRPVRCRISHFLIGSGISGLVYIWLVVWLFLVLFTGKRFGLTRRR